MNTAPVLLTTAGLTVEDVHRVAVEGAPVDVSQDVYDRVTAGRAVVERALKRERLVYGLNTHLGHLRDQRVSDDVLMRYQVLMVVGHAGGVGAPLADEEVRAIMLARIAGLARGGS